MPMTINEARDVQLHRREADGGATPLHPATCADVVAYSNADPAAGFDGTTARQALDELFRRLNAAEEAIPPVVAAPEIVQPTAAQVVPEGESLALKATPFALSAGRDSHAASEWKISGADGRQLWSSGEDAAHLESFPGLVPNRETLPGVTTGAAPGSVIRGIVHDDLFTSFSTSRFFMVKGGGATRFAFFKEAKASLRFLRVSEDDGATWRNAGVGAELPTSPVVNIVWTGNRLLSFLFERSADVPVYASDDLGATWEKIGVLPFKYASSLDVCHIQAQAENGRIVLAARNDYRFDMCVSKDHGATWTPVTLEEGKVLTLTKAHGIFVAGICKGTTPYTVVSYAASVDGENWKPIPGLDAPCRLFADDIGLVGVVQGGSRIVRVVGELFGTRDIDATFGNAAITDMTFDNGLYIAITGTGLLKTLACGAALPVNGNAEGTLADAPGWISGDLGELSGLQLTTASPLLLEELGGRKVIAFSYSLNSSAGYPVWRAYSGLNMSFALSGAMATETLHASVRYRGEKAGWSEWAEGVPFSAEAGSAGSDGENPFRLTDSATFHNYVPGSVSAASNDLDETFVVPDGVTSLLVLCVGGGVGTAPGWAASCRISVTPGESIPVHVGWKTGDSSFGTYLSCATSGVVCPSGKIFEMQGGKGNAGAVNKYGGGFAFLTSGDWLNFALTGKAAKPEDAGSEAPMNAGFGSPALSSQLFKTYGYGSAAGKTTPGLVKVWWGPRIDGGEA